jgi:hypothetical protein
MGSSLKDALVKSGAVKKTDTPQARQEAESKKRRQRENDEADARMNEPTAPPFEAPASGKIVEHEKPRKV